MTTEPLGFKTRGELWLAQWMQRFYRLRPRALESSPAQQFHLFGQAVAKEQGLAARSIPRTIWAYWNGATVPLLIQRCFENWRLFHPDFAIHILDDQSVLQHIPELPPELQSLPVAKRSDWIRLELLHRYGGIWLDASTILTESLEWVLRQQAHSNADFIGYYLDRYTSDPHCPVVESWFMAAPPHSPFIADLQREFTTEVIGRTGSEYIAHLQRRGLYDSVRQKIDIPEYLSIHLAMQVTLRSGRAYAMCLAKAEEGPFFLHVQGQWGRTPLKIRLLFSRIRAPLVPLIKLRNPDRKRLDLYLARGLYVQGSIAQRYLVPPQPQPAPGGPPSGPPGRGA